MAKAYRLRYTLARLSFAVEEVLSELSTNAPSLPQALTKGLEAYRKELTTVMALTGAAMVPTLNARAASAPTALENLLLRLIPRPSSKNVFVGDVVALNSPLHAPDAQNVLIRRVAAMEGDEMVSDDPEDEPFFIPPGHCWVLADNEELKPSDVIDSRSFGALPMQNILGRVMYFASSTARHGRVENNPWAQIADAPVLAAELDLEKLTGQ